MGVDRLTVTVAYFGIAILVGYGIVRVLRKLENPLAQLIILAVSAVVLWYVLVVLLLPQLGLTSL